MTFQALLVGINQYRDDDIGDMSGLELDESSKAILQQQMRSITIRLEGDDVGVAQVRQQLEKINDGIEVLPILVEKAAQAEYRLVVEQRRYYVYYMNQQCALFSMAKQYNTDSEHNVLQHIRYKARWRQKLHLTNPHHVLPLNAVSIVTEYEGKEAIDHDLLLYYQQHNEQWQQPRFKLKIVLNPQITRPLYCALFYFDANDGYIGADLLQGVWLMPNETTEANAFDGHFIPASIAENLQQQGVTKTHDFIKLMVSESEFDVTLFQQEGIKDYDLAQDQQQNNRGMRVRRRKNHEGDWVSKNITITTAYPLDSVDQQGSKE